MLNRRSLRTKVMQNLYAFDHLKKSHFAAAKDEIKRTFLVDPDLPIPTTTSPEQKKAIEVFENLVEKGASPEGSYKDLALMAQNHFEKAVEASVVARKGLIVKETEKIQDDFWSLLSCLWVLRKLDEEAKDKKRFPDPSWAFHFIDNPVFTKIFEHKNFTEARQTFWNENKATVRKWKREYLDENDKFIDYQMKPEATFEEHQKFVLYLFRKIFFKKEEPIKFFESNIQLWSQDGETLKNMIVKSMKEQTEVGPFVEIPLGLNWEEDREYLVKLFSVSIDDDKKLEEIISSTSKNWDIDRMAQTDSILLKMAISEFIHFPSIPIKVTINEYLEIAKKYSTPKSKLFINGILDVISQDLLAKGEIKKSGRGLIDNR